MSAGSTSRVKQDAGGSALAHARYHAPTMRAVNTRFSLCGLAVAVTLAVSASCASSAQCVDDIDCERLNIGATCMQGSCLASSAAATDAAPIAPDAARSDAGVLLPPSTCKGVADLRCVAAAPTGWTGPFAFFHGAAESQPAACSGFYPSVEPALVGLHGLGNAGGTVTGAPALCPACTPATPSGVMCTANQAVRGGPGCSTDVCTQFAGGPLGSCFNMPWDTCNNGGYSPYLTAVAVATGGVCITATKGTPSIPLPEWPESVAGCTGTPARVDCRESEVCVAKPAAPFEAKTCILQESSRNSGVCPGAPYNVLTYAAYQDVDDDRDCAACATSLVSATCTVTADGYGDNATCWGAPTTSRVVTATCPNSAQGDLNYFRLRAEPTGECSPAQSVPIGAVGKPKAKGAFTVCCTADFPN